MDDDTVGMCFQNENDLAALKEVIPLTGHRMRFIRAFREKLAEPSNEVRLDVSHSEMFTEFVIFVIIICRIQNYIFRLFGRMNRHSVRE